MLITKVEPRVASVQQYGGMRLQKVQKVLLL